MPDDFTYANGIYSVTLKRGTGYDVAREQLIFNMVWNNMSEDKRDLLFFPLLRYVKMANRMVEHEGFELDVPAWSAKETEHIEAFDHWMRLPADVHEFMRVAQNQADAPTGDPDNQPGAEPQTEKKD